jgi:hypothetical protein
VALLLQCLSLCFPVKRGLDVPMAWWLEPGAPDFFDSLRSRPEPGTVTESCWLELSLANPDLMGGTVGTFLRAQD